MSEVDVFLQYLLKWVILPLLTIPVIWYTFRKQLETLNKHFRVYAQVGVDEALSRLLQPQKQKLFAQMSDFLRSQPGGGVLLELGAGTGQNFQYYPEGCAVLCQDINECFRSRLERNAAANPHINYRGLVVSDATQKQVQVEDESVDAVVCTLLLCSVGDTQKVLSEIHRMLRKGGRFYYIEHVAAPKKSWFRPVQWFLSQITDLLFGCIHYKRTGDSINQSVFNTVDHHIFEKKFNKTFIKYVLSGVAIKESHK